MKQIARAHHVVGGGSGTGMMADGCELHRMHGARKTRRTDAQGGRGDLDPVSETDPTGGAPSPQQLRLAFPATSGTITRTDTCSRLLWIPNRTDPPPPHQAVETRRSGRVARGAHGNMVWHADESSTDDESSHRCGHSMAWHTGITGTPQLLNLVIDSILALVSSRHPTPGHT